MSKSINTLWYTRCPVPTAVGIAVQLGLFEREFVRDGITLNSLQESRNPDERESHFDHTLPSSFRQGGNIPAIWARARGRETRVIGLSWTDEFQGLIALPDSGIKNARDLRDRRIGLPVNPVSIDFNRASALRGFHSALDLEGLSLSNVEHVDLHAEPREDTAQGIGPDRERRIREGYRAEVEALGRGEVDAVFVKGALGIEVARRLGAEVIAETGFHPDPAVRINNGTPRTLTVDAQLLEERPDLVERFLSRVVEAGEWARTHPDETIAYIARETTSTSDAVRQAYGRDAHEKLGTFLTEPAIDALEEFKDFLFEHGFLEADFDARGWVDMGPLEQIDRAAKAA
ncbi:MAG: ABC transporter substrate-binding protein [Novosphingobium sp.]